MHIIRGTISQERALAEMLIFLFLVVFLIYCIITRATEQDKIVISAVVCSLFLLAIRIPGLLDGMSVLVDRKNRIATVVQPGIMKLKKEAHDISSAQEIHLRSVVTTVHSYHAAAEIHSWIVALRFSAGEYFSISFAKEINAQQCAEKLATFLNLPLHDIRGTGDRLIEPDCVGMPLTRVPREECPEPCWASPVRPRSSRIVESQIPGMSSFLLPAAGYWSTLGIVLIAGHVFSVIIIADICLLEPFFSRGGAAISAAQSGVLNLLLVSPFFLINIAGIFAVLFRSEIVVSGGVIRKALLFCKMRYCVEEMAINEVTGMTKEINRRSLGNLLSIQSVKKIIKVKGLLRDDEHEWLYRKVEGIVRNS